MINEKYMPRHPIFIISKGRHDTRYTAKALDEMGVFYRVAVEEHEYDLYNQYIPKEQLIRLPWSNHGKGSGPARNYCWEIAIEEGYDRHHLMDCNIYGFWRFHNNRKVKCKTPAMFRAMEDFVDRYENVALAGPQYTYFCPHDSDYKPVQLNSRLMSCILIKNDLPFRWRCRYNEDVDLSLNALKAGYTTMLFYNFLQDKAPTGTVKGGNTQELYGSGTYDKSKMLAMIHPDVVRMVHRYGRDHHHVDIRPFQHILPKLKEGVQIPSGVNEYGMKYVEGYGTPDVRVSESKPRER